VDLAFPLAPAFKITAALKRLWEAAPGGHEAYAGESNLASWLFVAPVDVWKMQRRTTRFPLDHSAVQAAGYVAIWAVERVGSPNRASIQDAINFFEDAAIIVVNMGILLQQTLLLLEQGTGRARMGRSRWQAHDQMSSPARRCGLDAAAEGRVAEKEG
jgi:hypothetical protein